MELYYVPKIEDIRVGYKCQWLEGLETEENGDLKETWNDFEVTILSNLREIDEAIVDNGIRTQYLTINDILDQEWTHEGEIIPSEAVVSEKPVCLHKFNKGRYILIYDFVAKVIMIAISVGDIFSVCVQRYDCPSINEFTYIYSHLNLH